MTQEYRDRHGEAQALQGQLHRRGRDLSRTACTWRTSRHSAIPDEMYSHKDAAGFINLYGLPLKVQAMMKEKAGLEK